MVGADLSVDALALAAVNRERHGLQQRLEFLRGDLFAAVRGRRFDLVLAENGWRSPGYSEDAASAYMKNDELVISVDLGVGKAARTVWTCDLTHRYIDINADYRS